jgi:hypothetical protein
MSLPVLLPVVGMLLAPFAGAIAADLAVLGISRKFDAMVFEASPRLALRPATDFLPRLELGWLERILAISAAPLTHTGVVASRSCRYRRRRRV